MCPTFADGLQLRGSDCRGDRPSLPRGERGVPDRHDAGHVADSNPSYQRKHTNRAEWSRCSVWKVRSISPYLSQEIASGQTGAGGIFEFDWRGYFNNFDQLMLVKVSPREVRHDPSGWAYSTPKKRSLFTDKTKWSWILKCRAVRDRQPQSQAFPAWGLVVMALILVGFRLRSYRRFIPA